jgi:hypothetical protein
MGTVCEATRLADLHVASGFLDVASVLFTGSPHNALSTPSTRISRRYTLFHLLFPLSFFCILELLDLTMARESTVDFDEDDVRDIFLSKSSVFKTDHFFADKRNRRCRPAPVPR